MKYYKITIYIETKISMHVLYYTTLNKKTLTVVAPMPKANMSVSEVTVMETPASLKVSAIRSGIGKLFVFLGNVSSA